MNRMLALIGLSIALSITMTLVVTIGMRLVPRLLGRDEEGQEAIEP
jgi:hypothetical protein